MLKQKILHIQTLLRAQKLDGLIIGNFGHQIHDDLLYYLLLQHLELGMLYVPSKGKPTLWGISFEVPQLASAYKNLAVKSYDKPLEKLIASKINSKKNIAIREQAFPHLMYGALEKNRHITLCNLTGDEQIMAIKLPEEVKILTQAGELTEILFDQLIANWKSFKTEADAVQFLLTNMAILGVEPSFTPIVASGKNAANPHHNFENKKIQKGFCVIDMGIRYKGYCSDMTRTIYVGKPSKKEKELYTRLLHIQKQTIELIKPGLSIKELDRFCRKELGVQLNKEFIHSLGHGLGTQVHEWPRVSSNIETRLKPGMCITIEPGVYKKNAYGMRIEDDIVVTKNGCSIITQTRKELILV